jgi:hypothetical protein
MKKISFTVKLPVDRDDPDNKETKEQTLEVIPTTLSMAQEAQLEYNRAFDRAMRSRAPLRIEVEKLLKDRGIWTETKQDELNKLNDELIKMERQLKAGGMKLTEARDLALKIRAKRDEITNLSIDRRILDGSTAEAQAETARFNWFVANATVYPVTGKCFFEEKGKENVQVYLEQSNTEYAQECARKFGVLQYGLDEHFERKLPENVFLLKFKFVREKDLRLINRDGELIDSEGHLLDEDGFRIDPVTRKRLDRDGAIELRKNLPPVQATEFLDDEGNPIPDSALTDKAEAEALVSV